MAILITDCPRCKSLHTTFDVGASRYSHSLSTGQAGLEAFCICRACRRSTIFELVANPTGNLVVDNFSMPDSLLSLEGAINIWFDVEGFVNLASNATISPPEHIPADVDRVFREGATCVSVNCFNAAATMFRLCVDLATKPLLPDGSDGGAQQPNEKTRRDLGLRLRWLFDQRILPEALRDLARCIHQDGNDGAHVGTVGREDAEDLIDFTRLLLERIFTEPERVRLAEQRRRLRRS